jgi:curved DNA-binding protein CbpA
MDADAARSVLGVEVGVTGDALKRAYLRALRAHSPERDPEGFRKVRDAFEFLRDHPWDARKINSIEFV